MTDLDSGTQISGKQHRWIVGVGRLLFIAGAGFVSRYHHGIIEQREWRWPRGSSLRVPRGCEADRDDRPPLLIVDDHGIAAVGPRDRAHDRQTEPGPGIAPCRARL